MTPFRSGLSFAAVGEDLVILDLPQDDYLCLPQAVRRDGDGKAWLREPAARALLDAGYGASVARAIPDLRLPDPPLALPLRDLRDHSTNPTRPNDIITAARALSDLRAAGPDPATARLIALADLPRSHDHGPPDIRLLRAAAAFGHLLPWLPFEGACLRRSALLAIFLRRQQLAARWVFGVRTWPFRAHCWLQVGHVCLNDDVERLRAYVPIFAT